VKSIDFSFNTIRSLQQFPNLRNFCPNAINFSFEGNAIKEFFELDHLIKMSPRELIFSQNPISQQPSYQKEFVRRFSTLKFLDKNRLTPVIQFNLPPHVISGQLPPTHGSYFDAPDRRDFVVEWVTRFITTYDSPEQREKLFDVYSEKAVFSLVCKAETESQEFEKYLQMNRNLLKVHDTGRRNETLLHGKFPIVSFLSKLPETEHDMAEIICDSVLLDIASNQILSVTVHGNFWEPAVSVNRTFSRTFLLTPTAPDSKAFQEGFKAIITNEMWAIYPYVGSLPNTEDVVTEGESDSLTSETTDNQKQLLLEQFASTTGLKLATAEAFLNKVNWDIAAAMAEFKYLNESQQIARDHFR